MTFFDVLSVREKRINIEKHDHSLRCDTINCILKIHASFSTSLKNSFKKDIKRGGKKTKLIRRYKLNSPSSRVVQLALLYMDSYISFVNTAFSIHIRPIDVGLACYMLAYKYENDDNTSGLHYFIIDNSGPNFSAHVLEIERFIWEDVFEFRVNLVTPIDFIEERFHELGIDDMDKLNYAKESSTKIMMSNEYYKPPSVIAGMSLAFI